MIEFDGSADYIDTGGSLIKNTGSFSVLLHFKLDSTSFARMFCHEGYSGGNGWGSGSPRYTYSEFHMGTGRYTGGSSSANYLHIFYGDIDDNQGDVASASYSFSDTSSWHSLMGTVDTSSGHTVKLFLDGAEVASDSGSGFTDANLASNFLIGKPSANDRYLDGKLADFRVVDRVVSLKEYKSYDAGFRGPFGDEILWYSFLDFKGINSVKGDSPVGAANVVTDLSKNGNNGTLAGSQNCFEHEGTQLMGRIIG